MRRVDVDCPGRAARGIRARAVALVAAVGMSTMGCGDGSQEGTNPPGEASASAGDNSGFQLPPGFKIVDLPTDRRKEVFREAHNVRALAVQEANQKLPMDEASLPIGNTAAFDKRVADHKAIIDGILAKNLAALAEKYKLSVADVEKIEEEARLLRWLPPQDPVLEEKPQEAGAK